jgi:predicted nucleic acid-binding protein
MAEREKEVRLVADTNIILSALLKDGSFIAEMMKTSGIQIYFPEYGLAEISAYKATFYPREKGLLLSRVSIMPLSSFLNQ